MLCVFFVYGSKFMVVILFLEMLWLMCYRYLSWEYVFCFWENLMKMNYCVLVDFMNGLVVILF